MAGSRLEKIGTIFWRVTGLIRSGVIREEDKPIWYTVYKAFPPKNEPRYDRPAPTREIPNLFYPEDAIRAKFYKVYGSPGIIDMANSRSSSISQRFVERFTMLQKQDPEASEDSIFKSVEDFLVADGVHLVRVPQEPDPTKKLDKESLRKPIVAQKPHVDSLKVK